MSFSKSSVRLYGRFLREQLCSLDAGFRQDSAAQGAFEAFSKAPLKGVELPSHPFVVPTDIYLAMEQNLQPLAHLTRLAPFIKDAIEECGMNRDKVYVFSREGGGKKITEMLYLVMERLHLQAEICQHLYEYFYDMRKANDRGDKETELAELIAHQDTSPVTAVRNTINTLGRRQPL